MVLILTRLLSYLWWARQMKKWLIQVYTLQITLLATGIEPAFVRKEVMSHLYEQKFQLMKCFAIFTFPGELAILILATLVFLHYN